MSKRISDYRHISLITSLYKIIAKVLAERLRGVLHETIHSTQGAFVQGRQILDAVLIANVIVDEKRRSGEEELSSKLTLKRPMTTLLVSVSFAVLVNGNAKGWVKASKGLRQGDPLSPFLFTIVADVLSRMLLRAEERNVLEGFRVGRNRTRVSYLQFADDTIFFSSTREEDMMTLKNVLLVFGHISGLKVNLDKSNIYSINLEQNHLSRLTEMFDYKASGWPIIYLGLPLGGNLKACGFWDPVIERISRRLDGWQKTFLPQWQQKLRDCKRFFMVRRRGRQKRSFGKWLWRYPREGSALWHQAIAQVFQEFSKFTRFVVGDGDIIRFWEDLWWGINLWESNIQDYLV
ncbi:putative mitochondrial protein [Vitis vinifera]|uniref:Putative mitochondrial protein n=1 Tax=Vitis vinifera TaxID=29760 RepID=A0A438J5W7_VITVI|nr:putative mitochondrial protein [Vitis vinifera]